MAGAVQSPNRLRPLGVGELLDAAIKVCTAHAGPLVKAVLVVVLPVQIISALVLASTVEADFFDITASDPEAGVDDTSTFLAGQLVVGLLSVVSYVLATGACFHAIAEGWLGREPDWRSSLRFAARRAHSLLWVSTLYFLGVVLGLVACIAPGIWIGIAWSVSYAVLFVEDERGTKALGRSFALVKDRWWASFGVIALGFALAAIVSGIFAGLVSAAAFVNDSLAFLIVVNTIGTLIGTLVTTPFQAAIATVLYFDLRVRKEGFDLELLAERLAGGAPVGVSETASPFTGPTGVGTPHPAAPYWPPPPGWTPPADAPAPSGWQPPGAEPAAGSSSLWQRPAADAAPTAEGSSPPAESPPPAWQPPGAESAPVAEPSPPAGEPSPPAREPSPPAGEPSPPAESPPPAWQPPGRQSEPAPEEAPGGSDPFGRKPGEGAAEDAFGGSGKEDSPGWLPPRSDGS